MTDPEVRTKSETEADQTILVIEDEVSVLQALRVSLTAHGYTVAVAKTGGAALEIAKAEAPALVLIDLGLPDMDGGDVIRELRKWFHGPILVLSARRGRGDKIDALDLGADDYVTKPYSMDELLARVRASLRRRQTPDAGQPVQSLASGAKVDLAAGRVVDSSGAQIKLTPTEWHLLEVLARNQGVLVGHAQLLSEVWGEGYETETNYLRLYIAQLRSKLEGDPTKPVNILTEQGRGYLFVAS
jgi:two-component system KDP operon response regulator KdpE